MNDIASSGESILDRVLLSQQTDALEHFDSITLVNELLKQLTNKEADVVRRRFGLGQDALETLEMIGKTYQVTRERVRQIERWAIKRLIKSPATKNTLRSLDVLIQHLFEERGGLMLEEDMLAELHSHSTEHPHLRSATLFLLQELMNDKLERVDSSEYKPFWKLRFSSPELLASTIAEAEKIIAGFGKPVAKDEVLNRFRSSEFSRTHQPALSDAAVLAYIHVSRTIERNPFGDYGLQSWGSIVPKRMNDKILLVLRRQGKPMHFQEITEKINEIGFDHRQAYPPTVHNELILNQEYVLVGRGIYALREWGYKPGVVADVILDILQRTARPMSREEIVQQVLEQRQVKKNTIHLALTNRQLFNRDAAGNYALATPSPETNTNHELQSDIHSA